MIRTLVFNQCRNEKDLNKYKEDVATSGGQVVETEVVETFREAWVRIQVKTMDEFWSVVRNLKDTPSGKLCNNCERV